MNFKEQFLVVVIFCFFTTAASYAQDSILVESLQKNKSHFQKVSDKELQGEGWNLIVDQARRAQYFLIGEVHGINEVPLFIEKLTGEVEYETFVAEIDPFLVEAVQDKVERLDDTDLQSWYKLFGHNLSFYSYQQDFELLKNFFRTSINVVGIDQITALNDIPIYLYLKELTLNKERSAIYHQMSHNSKVQIEKVLKEGKEPPYLMSAQFERDLALLREKELPLQERQILDQLEESRKIYTSRGGHERRIRLMKNHLMSNYDRFLHKKKVLFRLGANHSSKGESFSKVYDVGNLAFNLAESEYASSYHVAILPKNGEAGSPFKGQPAKGVERLKDLTVLYELAADDQWTFFDLSSVKALVEKGEIKIENELLKNFIKGYDGVIIVPKSTAALHANVGY